MTDKAAQLKQDLRNQDWPQPVGWRILVDPVKPKSVSDGGIILSDESQQAELHLNYVGRVVDMGPLAYKHAKFEGGFDWCGIGDWIAYGQYAGQTITVKDQDAIDAADSMREAIAIQEEAVVRKTSMVRASVGGPDVEDLREELAKMQADLRYERKKLVKIEENIEHRLRLLNDDEVLAVIPNKDAIRIYI